MRIILNDGTELNAFTVNGASRFFQGSQRDSLEFVFVKGDYTFDDLEQHFADTLKTEKITLVDDDENKFVYDDYVLRVTMSLSPEVIIPATSTEPEVIEERISIVMAQKVYIETQLDSLRDTVDVLVLESLGV